MRGRPTTVEAFWAQVKKTPDCWIWKGPVSTRGVGMSSIDGFRENAHRIAYRLLVDDTIEEDTILKRQCRNLLCVNPNHIRRCLSDAEKLEAARLVVEEGLTPTAVGRRLGVRRENVSRYASKYREEGQAS